MTATREEILRRLERVLELDSDIRFGQLVANLASISIGPWDQTLWDAEDEQLLGALRQIEKDLAARNIAVA